MESFAEDVPQKKFQVAKKNGVDKTFGEHQHSQRSSARQDK
jgi:hypothetical protein